MWLCEVQGNRESVGSRRSRAWKTRFQIIVVTEGSESGRVYFPCTILLRESGHGKPNTEILQANTGIKAYNLEVSVLICV